MPEVPVGAEGLGERGQVEVVTGVDKDTQVSSPLGAGRVGCLPTQRSRFISTHMSTGQRGAEAVKHLRGGVLP